MHKEITQEQLEKSQLKKIGDFRIFQDIQLGKGTFGVVYLASNYNSNRTVSVSDPLFAAKAINKKTISDPKKLAAFEERVYKEIFILKKIKHPNVIELRDVRSTDNNFYLIFEYCSGGTLESYRVNKKNKGKLPEPEALQIIKQIAEAMQFCVSMNPPIIHRDLKPANVMLENGKVKVGDFGLARLVEDDQIQMTVKIGSPLYMAPQVYSGEKYSFKCDVWSLGIILYELLYGITPWISSKGTEKDLFENNILKKKLVFPQEPHVREVTKGLITHMLRMEEEERATFEEVLSHEALLEKKRKIKEENEPLLRSSSNRNMELLNKYPEVENCYVNSGKLQNLSQGKILDDDNDEAPAVYEEKDLLSKEELLKNNEAVLNAQDYVGFYLNIVRFLRRVSHHIKANEKKLKEMGLKKQSFIQNMLFITKMELIIMFQVKKLLENGKVNQSLSKEFYASKAKDELLTALNENFDGSLSVFEDMLEEAKDFEGKSTIFQGDFNYSDSFNKLYRRNFHELWDIICSKIEKLSENDQEDPKLNKLGMEVRICRSFESLFEFFRFVVDDENNTHQFYKLYQDLKIPKKVASYIEKSRKEKKN